MLQKTLERVQRRVTYLAWRMQQLSFERRLDTLNLYTLSYRQDRGLIVIYEIMKLLFWFELGN